MTSSLSSLVGRTVTAVHTAKGLECVVFKTDAGDVAFDVYGDCCSSSWIEHASGLDALVGQVVVSARDSDPVDDEEDDRDERVQVYQCHLETARGVFSLEFRNGSNGYYGGDLEPANVADKDMPPEVSEDF